GGTDVEFHRNFHILSESSIDQLLTRYAAAQNVPQPGPNLTKCRPGDCGFRRARKAKPVDYRPGSDEILDCGPKAAIRPALACRNDRNRGALCKSGCSICNSSCIPQAACENGHPADCCGDGCAIWAWQYELGSGFDRGERGRRQAEPVPGAPPGSGKLGP